VILTLLILFTKGLPVRAPSYFLPLCLSLLSTLVWGQNSIQTLQLDNGLTVIAKPDHRSPVIVSMVWYDVGSADEPGGITGVSHVLEHLMFKGTLKYPLGVFSKKIAALGGQENAFTHYDYTAYFEKLAASDLAVSFELEADRMRYLQFNPTEFSKELNVIQEERRLRTDDNPQALLFERFMAASQLSSPYHHPVIGWMSDIQHITPEDAKAWYKQYYAPNHAALVVVGDIEASTVFTLAKKYFGAIPKAPDIQRKSIIEPPTLGMKHVEINAPAQIPVLILGYTVPSRVTALKTSQADPYALTLIAALLDASDNSRLQKQLVRNQQIASNIGVGYEIDSRYQNQFMIYATPRLPHTLDELKPAILFEIERLITTPVSQEELQQVKKQLIAQKTFEQDSIFTQAMTLGVLQTAGLPLNLPDEYAARINAITPTEIQQTAQRYFSNDRLTEAFLLPLPKKDSR